MCPENFLLLGSSAAIVPKYGTQSAQPWVSRVGKMKLILTKIADLQLSWLVSEKNSAAFRGLSTNQHGFRSMYLGGVVQ